MKTKASRPLVTVTIPTYNSARTLADCLTAVKNQSYPRIEINIVDSYSKDDTVAIAKKFDAMLKKCRGSLLESRYTGVKIARGSLILLLDSDQILHKRTIERAVSLLEKKKFDMLAFEEGVYRVTTIIEKLFQMDRRVINHNNNLDPFSGVILPRFFRKTILKKAYENIPMKEIPNTGGPDHAIVYYEAWLISKKVGNLTNAVRHIEPYTIQQLIRKFYRWGYTSVDAHYGPYGHLMRQKERFRTGLFAPGLFWASVCSIILLVFKGLAFKTGYYVGVYERFTKEHH